MPKVPMDYSRTIMYKIVCNDLNITDLYCGHTTNWNQRKSGHKCSCTNENSINYNLKIYQTIRKYGGWNNWSMIFIENYACNNLLEACKRERQLTEELEATMNMNKAYCSKEELPQQRKEYRELNKDEIIQKNKEYRKNHKDEIIQKIKSTIKIIKMK
jgi:hypothetical protein